MLSVDEIHIASEIVAGRPQPQVNVTDPDDLHAQRSRGQSVRDDVYFAQLRMLVGVVSIGEHPGRDQQSARESMPEAGDKQSVEIEADERQHHIERKDEPARADLKEEVPPRIGALPCTEDEDQKDRQRIAPVGQPEEPLKDGRHRR